MDFFSGSYYNTDRQEVFIMKNQRIQERIEKLRRKMEAENIRFYIVPTADYHNSEYVDDYFKVREFFSGFTGSNGTLVVSAEEAGLWTDGRYFIQAEKELEGTGITLFRMQEEGVPEIWQYLEEKTQESDLVAFDGRVVDTAFGKKLEKKLEAKSVKLYYEDDPAAGLWIDRPGLPAHPVTVLPDALCGVTTEEKLAAVRKKMRREECSYLLLSKLDDLMWLLNIRGSDVECNPVALSYGLITMDEMFYFIGGRAVTPQFRTYAQERGIILKEYADIIPFLKTFSYEGRVLADEKNISYLLYKTVSERAEILNQSSPTEWMKAVKNPVELDRMREIYLKDSVVVTKFIYWLKQNVGRMELTEVSAADYLDGLRAQTEGFLDLSFPTISAYKENAAMMHYEAMEGNCKKLAPEGMLLVDSGGQYLGGTTDVTRTIVLGAVSQEIKKHYSAVAAGMLQLSQAKFLYGCTGRNLDILARKPLWDMGIDYKCGTGHGVGYILNVHEGPQGIRWRFAPGSSEAVLEAGMDVTNEPGVYIEGSHGIRIENVMVVRNGVKNGDGQFMEFETLTFVPIDREALDKDSLRTEDIERINAYHKQVYDKISAFLTEEERTWLGEATAAL